ncbi:hypothetical protein RJK70_02005 [Buchnera aphidicola (Pseudoregma panicola)]|uniref:hypothetical protein n=1 Tax=Buchnera aphidicola TaxID=9 RepID=UPI0031B7FB39
MSYVYNISKITSSKNVINVNSKDSTKENEKDMFQDYKVDSIENPEVSAIITLVPEKKPFFNNNIKKTVIKISNNNLNKKDNAKVLKKHEKVVKKNENDLSSLTINKFQIIKHINEGEESAKFTLFYDKIKHEISFTSKLFRYKGSKIDNLENDVEDNDLISTVLPSLTVFKEDYKNKVKINAKMSYSAILEGSNKFTNIYSSKDITLDISKNKFLNKNLTKNVKGINKKNKSNLHKALHVTNPFQGYDISKDKSVDPISFYKPKSIKDPVENKVGYKHDAKVVHMNGFPLHNRCCEVVSKVDETKSNKQIEEKDNQGNEWKLLNDANESFSLVKFGKDIRSHFDYLNRNNEEDLHKIFMSELGHVEMSINGKSITKNKDPREILKKFKNLLPNISDRKLVSCFAQEGVLAKSFFGIISKYPDILKCTFYHPKISYNIHRIDENSFEVDICSITKSRDFNDFNNVGAPYLNTISSYGMKTNVVFSKISNPIIKNLFFIK